MPFEVRDIASLAEAAAHVRARAAVGRRVLLLCDIDNTVLRMPSFVGSDEWFRWQLGLIRAGASFGQGRVAVDLEHLRSLLADVYASSRAIACEGPATRDALAGVAGHACRLVFVTARSEATRASTIRHLGEALGLEHGADYDLVLCSGGSKSAAVLRALGAPVEYDHVVFVDDSFDNVVDVVFGLPLGAGQSLACMYYAPRRAGGGGGQGQTTAGPRPPAAQGAGP
jgi:Protein of unknown function (DUF2608)